jgi:hypothetical protein
VSAPVRGEALRCQNPVLQGSSIVAAASTVNVAAATSTGAVLAIETMPTTSTATADDDSNTVQLVPVATDASINVSQQSVPAVAGQQQISTAVRTGTDAADAAAEGQHTEHVAKQQPKRQQQQQQQAVNGSDTITAITDKKVTAAASMIGAVPQCTESMEQRQAAVNYDTATADAKERCAAVTVITAENKAMAAAADAVGCVPMKLQQAAKGNDAAEANTPRTVVGCSDPGVQRLSTKALAKSIPAAATIPQQQQHTNTAGLSKVAAVAPKPPAPQHHQQISTAGLKKVHTKPVACEQQQQEQTSIAQAVNAKPVAAVAAAA